MRRVPVVDHGSPGLGPARVAAAGRYGRYEPRGRHQSRALARRVARRVSRETPGRPRSPRVVERTRTSRPDRHRLQRGGRGRARAVGARAARASAVDVARPRKGADGGWIAETVLDEGRSSGGGDDDDDGHGAFLGLAGQPSRRADVCVFRVERDLEDVAEALRAGVGSDTNSSVLATGACFAIGQIRLGRRSRHRRANERAAGAFRAKGFTRVRVLHLLSDREHERTLACRVGYG